MVLPAPLSRGFVRNHEFNLCLDWEARQGATQGVAFNYKNVISRTCHDQSAMWEVDCNLGTCNPDLIGPSFIVTCLPVPLVLCIFPACEFGCPQTRQRPMDVRLTKVIVTPPPPPVHKGLGEPWGDIR